VQLVRGPGTRLDRREYVPPPPNKAAPWIPPRDWGRQTITQALLGGNPDIGVFIGMQLDTKAYGFRQDPYMSRQTVRAGYATSARSGRIEYEGEFRRSNSGLFTSVFARASGIEILRFYGFGNETSHAGPDQSFKVKQDQFVLAPSVGVFLTPRLTFSLGPRVKYAKTDLAPGRFITATRPYGVDKFGEAGLGGALRFDSRDHAAAATRGLLFDTAGSFYPAIWDVKRGAFGEVHGDVATYLSATSAPLQPTLALRAGGKRVWGDYPFFEAAFIGGSSTVRGFRPQRFAGDAAVYGNAELRLSLARVFIILPAEMGVFGLADGGRVYVGGQTSDKWHTAAGGGLWFAFLNRDATLTVAAARSQERTGLYVRAGFVF
jgi:outer membrane protein assembly factor BamA